MAKNKKKEEILKMAELIIAVTVQCENKNDFIMQILSLPGNTQEALVELVGRYIEHN